jgi:hypothetical protein
MLKVGIPALAGGLRVADVMTEEVAFLETSQTLDEAWQILHAQSIRSSGGDRPGALPPACGGGRGETSGVGVPWGQG